MRAVRVDGSVCEDVFAIGDVARFANPLFDNVARRVEHWNIPTDTAKRVGQVLATQLNAAENATEILDEAFAPMPSFWSDQFEMHILAFGLLGVADEVKLMHGEIEGECVFGYYRDGAMIGVCGIGMRSTVQGYRAQVGAQS
jgi:NADPH-dependent 2,4-dienoyl-CoA reductase/sulfur reductase-like enzyme